MVASTMEHPTKTQDAQRLKYYPLQVCFLCKGDARSRRALLQALHATCCRGQDMGLAHQLAPDLAPGLVCPAKDDSGPQAGGHSTEVGHRMGRGIGWATPP
jgi:hypothetical protein